ncbi:unnamed protein product [Lupinus luteus]|uniref:Histone-lysine N-methyltransferase n=1 Tax=Lupinus luteus TaxID=3873 RepID=A0AAV1W328_LUPLU
MSVFAQTCNSEQTRIGSAYDKLVKQLGEPADFKLPEWFTKLKRMPYTFIKRNIYPAKKLKRRFEDDGIFCSCIPSPESPSLCGIDCHCILLLSSCSSSCKCRSSCRNKAFQHRHVKKMKLVQTEKCGYGIVADEDIKLGDFVIEYVGEVINDKTCEERLWDMKHRGETNFYLVIDGETRLGIFAIHDIQKGEQLTYDYQFVQFGPDQDCHCGAVGCRRKLGVKSGKLKMSSDAALRLVAPQVASSSLKK